MGQQQLKSNSLPSTRLYVQFSCDQTSAAKEAKCLFLHLEVNEFESNKPTNQTKPHPNVKTKKSIKLALILEFKNI